MPYSGPSDDSLPANVQKLPANKRRAFVHAFNSAYGDVRKGEDASERERRAFAVAHAAANRAGSKSMDETDAVPVVVVEEWESPYEKLRTFAELDAVREAEKSSSALQMVFNNFQMLAGNILRNDDLTAGQKSAALTALSTELDARLAIAREDPDSAFKAEFTDPTDDPGTFVAFKDANGDYRWTTIHTNRYRDKYGEILTDAAHREYVDWANEHPESLPVLRFWHIPAPTQSELHEFRATGKVPEAGLDLGRADLVFYDDNGFVGATGTFYPSMYDAAQKLSEMKSLGCSHGFIYSARDKKDGIIERYKSFETTLVPRPYEANTLTLGSVEEATMLSPKQREAAVGLWGEAKVKSFEEATSQLKAQAEAEGVDYKAVAEALTEPASTEAEPTLQDQIDAAVRRALAERDAEARDETIVETGTIAADGSLVPGPAPMPVVETPVAAQAELVPVEVPGQPPADEGSLPVPPEEASPTQPRAEAPADTKSVADPMAGILAAMNSIVTSAMAPVTAAILELQQGQKSLGERVAEVEVDGDTKLANKMRPKVGPISATPASADPATELPPDYAEAFRNTMKAAETPEQSGDEDGQLNLVERYGLVNTLKNASLLGGDAE